MHIVNTDTKWIRVAFITIIIRNASIKAKYPGGMLGFSEAHAPTSNDDISLLHRTGGDLEETYSVLCFKGLKPGGDFTVLDEFTSELPPWLSSRYKADGFYVSYAEKLNEDEFVLEALRIIGIDPLSMGYQSYRIVRKELLRSLEKHGYDRAMEDVRGSAEHHKGQIEYLMSLAD